MNSKRSMIRKRDSSGYNTFKQAEPMIRDRGTIPDEQEQLQKLKNMETDLFKRNIKSEKINDMIERKEGTEDYFMFFKNDYIQNRIKQIEQKMEEKKQVEIKSNNNHLHHSIIIFGRDSLSGIDFSPFF